MHIYIYIYIYIYISANTLSNVLKYAHLAKTLYANMLFASRKFTPLSWLTSKNLSLTLFLFNGDIKFGSHFEKWPLPRYAQFLKFPPSRILKPYVYIIQINSQTSIPPKCLRAYRAGPGLISGTSKTDVLVELVHVWYKATDKLNYYVRVVMLDFCKAFDLINHNLVLNKLQSCRLPAHNFRWMATFILDRAQRVKIGNEYSHSGHPNVGIPQGILCVPKCFLVYVNDLRTTDPLYKHVVDSPLFEICDRKGVSVIQESVDIAARWTKYNFININSENFKEMIISFAQDGNCRSTISNLKIDGRDITQVCHAKLLGVTISQDLTWNTHVKDIVKKVGKRL